MLSAEYEATICYSKTKCERFMPGAAGDGTPLCGGKCGGRTLPQMYAENWRLINIIEGLDTSFGFVLERKK